jgi:hypothetical protein
MKQIEEAKRAAAVPFDVALQLRKVLDDARTAYGAKRWDEDDLESQVLDLLTGEARS